MREEYFNVTGGKIWCKIVGEDKLGTPLLILHGGPGAPHNYLENLEILSDFRPVIFYDQLGCGLSDRSNDTTLWNVERFVEEISIIREKLNLEQINILGQSWGSMLAVEYFLQNKNNGVNSLILSGPFLSAPMFAEDVRREVNELPEKIKNIIFNAEKTGNFTSNEYQEAMNVFYEKHVCRLIPWPKSFLDTFDKMGFDVYSFMWGPSEFSIFGILKDYDLSNRLGEIDIPVLLTCGEFDEITPLTLKFYAQKIKNSESIVFKEASHMHHLEKQEEYIKNIKKFLEKSENHQTKK